MCKIFIFLMLANALFSASVAQGWERALSDPTTTECVSDQMRGLQPHNTLSTTILARSRRADDDCYDYDYNCCFLDYTNSTEVSLGHSTTSQQTLHLHVRKLPCLEETAPNAWADITYTQNGSEHTLQLLRTCTAANAEKNLYEISLFLSDGSEQTSNSLVKILTTCGEVPSQGPSALVTESFCAQYNALSASITNMLWVSLPLTKEVFLTLHTNRDALHKVTLQSSCMEDKCYTFPSPPTPIVPRNPCTDFLCCSRYNSDYLNVSAFNRQEVETCWVWQSESRILIESRRLIEVLAPKTVGWSEENSSIHLATCSVLLNSQIMGRTFKFKFTVFAQKTESEEGFENYTVFSKGSDPQDVVPVAYFKTPCNEPLTTVACAGVNITRKNTTQMHASKMALCIISQNTHPQNAFSIITSDGSIIFRQNDKNTSVIRGCWPSKTKE